MSSLLLVRILRFPCADVTNLSNFLGFIWLLILHYQIKGSPTQLPAPETEKELVLAPAKPQQQQQQADPKVLLLGKINNILELQKLPYEASNFTSDWSDGMRFGALLHAKNSDLPPNWADFKRKQPPPQHHNKHNTQHNTT